MLQIWATAAPMTQHLRTVHVRGFRRYLLCLESCTPSKGKNDARFAFSGWPSKEELPLPSTPNVLAFSVAGPRNGPATSSRSRWGFPSDGFLEGRGTAFTSLLSPSLLTRGLERKGSPISMC